VTNYNTRGVSHVEARHRYMKCRDWFVRSG
jgi:hypothetical protein